MSEFKEFNSQMVLTGVGILFNEIIVLERHQDSVSRAAVQTGLGADFANAQLLMIEAETVQNLRRSVDPVNPVPLRGSFWPFVDASRLPPLEGSFLLVSYAKTAFRNTTEGIDGVNHGFTIGR